MVLSVVAVDEAGETFSAATVGVVVVTWAASAEDAASSVVLLPLSLPPSDGLAVETEVEAEAALAEADAVLLLLLLLLALAPVEALVAPASSAPLPPPYDRPQPTSGLLPGSAVRFPVMASSMGGEAAVQLVDWSRTVTPGHLSMPESPALHVSMMFCRVATSQAARKSPWPEQPDRSPLARTNGCEPWFGVQRPVKAGVFQYIS